jgi:hypothetical protein
MAGQPYHSVGGILFFECGLKRHDLLKYFALTANLHLFLPAFLSFPMTDCSANAPAILACPKFPRRAILANFFGAFLQIPAGFAVFICISF